MSKASNLDICTHPAKIRYGRIKGEYMELAEVKTRFALDFRIREQTLPETLPAGIPQLPSLGLPRGCLTEIFGPPSSGRTSLVLSVMAQAAERAEFCRLVDAGD